MSATTDRSWTSIWAAPDAAWHFISTANCVVNCPTEPLSQSRGSLPGLWPGPGGAREPDGGALPWRISRKAEHGKRAQRSRHAAAKARARRADARRVSASRPAARRQAWWTSSGFPLNWPYSDLTSDSRTESRCQQVGRFRTTALGKISAVKRERAKLARGSCWRLQSHLGECLLSLFGCHELSVRFREEFRAPAGVRKSPRKEPAGHRSMAMGISICG
jgi:hypothetical protein